MQKITRRAPGFYITAALTAWITLSTAAVLYFTAYYLLTSVIDPFELIFLLCTLICRSLALYGILRCLLQPRAFYDESRFVLAVPFVFADLGMLFLGLVAGVFWIMLAVAAPEVIFSLSLLLFQTDGLLDFQEEAPSGAVAEGNRRAVKLESIVDRILLPYHIVAAVQSEDAPIVPAEDEKESQLPNGAVMADGLALPTIADDGKKLWSTPAPSAPSVLPAYQTAS